MLTARLKDAEVEAIRRAIALSENVGVTFSKAEARAREELLLKLERIAEFGVLKKKKIGVPVKDAIAIFTSVLGPRLAIPPNPDGAWWAIQQRALTSAGFTLDHLEVIAKTAARKWSGTIKIDSLFRQAVALLADSQDEGRSLTATAPLGMEKV